MPLSDKPDLVTSLDQVVENVPPGTVNVSDGVDMMEIATIAASINPDLRAIRMKRNVARAEAFSAGLLPDPELDASVDHPTDSKYLDGYNLGLKFDVRSMFTRPIEKAAAENKALGVDMDILWKEWQVIQRARTLYVEKYFGAQKLSLLRQMTALDKEHQSKSQASLDKGGGTLEQASADLTSLMDAEGQMRAQQRLSLQTDYALNALLGLAPGVDVSLRPPGLPSPVSEAMMRGALDSVAEHRPDLKALRAAYKSQEASLYAAVLRQFPSISVGFNTARDTTNIHSMGLGVTLDLPIFNGSRGDIAVQSATREQLHAEYQARLDQTHADIATLWRQTEMIRRQLGDLQAQLPKLQAMVDKAHASGNLPALSSISLQSTLLSRKMEYLDLQQALWTNRIGLDTLLAWPLGPAADKEEAPLKN